MSRRTVSVLGLALLLAVLGSTVAVTRSPSASASTGDGSFHQTKTLTRTFGNDGADSTVVDSRTVTVDVSQTTQLQGRERVHITWRGARPSAGRSANPFGEAGLNQEYPVVIMQCRGLDNPSLPSAKQVTPQTCWTSTQIQRSTRTSSGDAVWIRDLYASTEDQQVKSGLTPYPATDCNDSDPTAYAHVTPFVAATGKTYDGCTNETMPPEAAAGSSFPAAEQAAFTNTNGTGSADFEVRSSVENESLGCSDKVACSIEVIPIMGLSCVAKDPNFAASDRNCRRAGQFLPGSSNFGNLGVDDSVSPRYWWAASNWRNRFSVPISFGLPPGACDVLDPRAPTAFYGSELLSQAALQWAPAYCLRKDRFKWQQNNMPDDAAFQLMEDGTAAAAEVSGKRERDGTDPVAYAPTAVTGFAVSYVVDKPGNAGEYTSLRLNARLIAKLLTESYPASTLGEQHPGIGKNPRSITVDPEFRALNPGLSDVTSEAAATIMSLSNQSDVISTLTSYIASDPDAVAFIDGKPDPWGMTVNPFYKGTTVPTSQWQLKDTFVPKSSLVCYQQNPAPYLPQVAAPVASMRQIANAVLDSWPLVATKCDRSLPTDPWKLGRVDRQGMGSRFLLGITTLGDAHRFGLRTAALQAAPGHYVLPDSSGLASALALATPDPGSKVSKGASSRKAKTSKGSSPSNLPLVLDQKKIRRSATAYPGTMIVYTAARTHGMSKTDAKQVASFIKISSTQGQQPGRGNGQLPDGYLPIKSSGVTAPLYRQAQRVAVAIAAQKGPKTAKAHAGGHSGAGSSSAGAAGTTAGSGSSAATAPATTTPVTPVTAKTAEPESTVKTIRTALVSAGAGGWLLPVLLGLALTGLVLSGFSRYVLRSRGVR